MQDFVKLEGSFTISFMYSWMFYCLVTNILCSFEKQVTSICKFEKEGKKSLGLFDPMVPQIISSFHFNPTINKTYLLVPHFFLRLPKKSHPSKKIVFR